MGAFSMWRPTPTQPCNNRQILGRAISVYLLLVLVTCSPAAAQVSIEGNLRASSFQFDQDQPTEAKAYLLGFRQNARDESPYAWSFMAEEVEIALTTQHYMAYQEIDNQTEYTIHRNVHGVLLERFPLAYFMATSSSPESKQGTFGLSLNMPPATMEPRNDINFDVRVEEEYPAFGSLYTPGDTQPFTTYQQPWPNLARGLQDFHGAIRLDGNFVLNVFDTVFRVDEGTASTTYNATYGGWRGAEASTDQSDPPSPEWDVRYAQLTFTNASLQFLPAGRPLELNLRFASMDLSGDLTLRDARGQLQDAKGIRSLEGSIVNLDVDEALVGVQPDSGSTNPPGVELALTGQVHSVAVDGRVVPLDGPTEQTGSATPTPITPGVEKDSFSLTWLLVLALAFMALLVLVWVVVRRVPLWLHQRLQDDPCIQRLPASTPAQRRAAVAGRFSDRILIRAANQHGLGAWTSYSAALLLAKHAHRLDPATRAHLVWRSWAYAGRGSHRKALSDCQLLDRKLRNREFLAKNAWLAARCAKELGLEEQEQAWRQRVSQCGTSKVLGELEGLRENQFPRSTPA